MWDDGPLGRERINRHCFCGCPEVHEMKPADAVRGKEAEKLRVRVRVRWRNVKPVEAETIESTAGPSDHDALAKRSQRADDRCGGIDGDVIRKHHTGRRIDFARYG